MPQRPSAPPAAPRSGPGRLSEALLPARGAVIVEVSKRLLRVGGAVYPVHNITQIQATTLRPKKMEAFLSMLKWLLAVAAVYIVVAAISEMSRFGDSDESDAVGLLRVLSILMVLGLIGRFLFVCVQPVLLALVVETASGSVAMLTLPDRAMLGDVSGRLIDAVENPNADFHMTVQRLDFNPKNFHIGDNVNMYGGIGNTGVSK
ncbi:DUF6232 family protein [Streptomyces sp. NPDC050504]|uniref:DUF6232 family protein n=1 Tax=Streptomyces sp. NPDC050504 TaxID=3365618 RepID=UPI0037972AF2